MKYLKYAALAPVYAVLMLVSLVMGFVGILAGLLAYVIAGGIMLYLLRLVLGAL